MTRHFLVVGAQRCGTTYLCSLLDAHPDIAMARPAQPEPKVFLSADRAARGADWYRRTYFAHAGPESLLGEKSTSYLEHPEAAERAASVLGSVQIVVQLRDPVERAVSNWRFSTAHGLEDRTLPQALEENLEGPRAWSPEATSVSPYAYLERGRFAGYLQPWMDRFPGAVHVQFLEDLSAQGASIGETYAALGADPDFRPDELGRVVNRSEEPAPALAAALVDRLRAYFRDSDARLRLMLGRDLPWPGAPADGGKHP